MATNICFTSVRVIGGEPIEDISAQNENITSSGTSQATTLTAGNGDFIMVVETDTDVWVTAGDSPTAVVGTGRLCQAGTARYFSVQQGWSAAVINA